MWFLPIISTTLVLLIPLVAIAGALYVRTQRIKLQHETLRQFAASGQPIPAGVLQDDEGWRTGASGNFGRYQLRTGAINIGLGLALVLMFYLMQAPGGGWMWSIGCIPLFIGISLLVVWAIERKSRPSG